MQHSRRAWWDSGGASRLQAARPEPSIVGLVQGGDGCVLNSLFSVQMFLVVWLSARGEKGGDGGGGDYTTLSL